MRFGFHISIAGGFSKVVKRARERRCETIQLFSRNPRGWRFSKLDAQEVGIFRREIEDAGIWPVFVHLPYLANLASLDRSLFDRSVRALAAELVRAETLGSLYVVAHAGRGKGTRPREVSRRVSEALNRAFDRVRNRVMVLLENTAGGSGQQAGSFEHLALVIGGVDARDRVGVCLDTAHAFQEGFDLRSARGLKEIVAEFDRTVGLEHLQLLHLNDSRSGMGSHADRHWHIGRGRIGSEGFRRIVNHPSLRRLPGIMETPRMSTRDDLRNLGVIVGLAASRR